MRPRDVGRADHRNHSGHAIDISGAALGEAVVGRDGQPSSPRLGPPDLSEVAA